MTCLITGYGDVVCGTLTNGAITRLESAYRQDWVRHRCSNGFIFSAVRRESVNICAYNRFLRRTSSDLLALHYPQGSLRIRVQAELLFDGWRVRFLFCYGMVLSYGALRLCSIIKYVELWCLAVALISVWVMRRMAYAACRKKTIRGRSESWLITAFGSSDFLFSFRHGRRLFHVCVDGSWHDVIVLFQLCQRSIKWDISESIQKCWRASPMPGSLIIVSNLGSL